jgi:hypothetical protein
MPDLIPQSQKELMRLLHAVRHAQRYPVSDTKRGRPARWPREDLFKVADRLGRILERETLGRISVASFIDHYLRLLTFPTDVLEALSAGELNLAEAAQLSRLTPSRLGTSPRRAKQVRANLLLAHTQMKLSGTRLRERVAEILRSKLPAQGADLQSHDQMDLEDFDPYDPTHLFWEQIKQLGFAFRDIRREDLMDEEIEELLKASEPIMTILNRIQRRKAGESQRLRL